MLVTAYDYWGYYNICYLAGEVKKPERNVPRAVLISMGLVAAIYLLMNISVLGVIPWQQLQGQVSDGRALFGDLRFHAADLRRMGGEGGDSADHVDGVRIGLLVIAGLFARAVRGGAGRKLLRGVGRLHPRYKFPHVSLLVLGAVATAFCLLQLTEVIAALVVIRLIAAIPPAAGGPDDLAQAAIRRCRVLSACGCIRCRRFAPSPGSSTC